MAKKVEAIIKLQIPSGKANPAPPVGPALGQRGVNIMEFCKAFNASTQKMEPGIPLPVEITVYADRSFTFITKTPPVTYFIKKKLGLESGSKEPGKSAPVAEITWKQCKEIATEKMVNMNANDIEAAAEMIAGSARSMGIKVKRD